MCSYSFSRAWRSLKNATVYIMIKPYQQVTLDNIKFSSSCPRKDKANLFERTILKSIPSKSLGASFHTLLLLLPKPFNNCLCRHLPDKHLSIDTGRCNVVTTGRPRHQRDQLKYQITFEIFTY